VCVNSVCEHKDVFP
jgi:uncharacterized membrane protein YfcA